MFAYNDSPIMCDITDVWLMLFLACKLLISTYWLFTGLL